MTSLPSLSLSLRVSISIAGTPLFCRRNVDYNVTVVRGSSGGNTRRLSPRVESIVSTSTRPHLLLMLRVQGLRFRILFRLSHSAPQLMLMCAMPSLTSPLLRRLTSPLPKQTQCEWLPRRHPSSPPLWPLHKACPRYLRLPPFPFFLFSHFLFILVATVVTGPLLRAHF